MNRSVLINGNNSALQETMATRQKSLRLETLFKLKSLLNVQQAQLESMRSKAESVQLEEDSSFAAGSWQTFKLTIELFFAEKKCQQF